MLKVIKSNLNEHNRGICGSPNNARFTGTTVVWQLIEGNEVVAAVGTKKHAIRIAEWANSDDFDWETQDLEIAFRSANCEDVSIDNIKWH